MKFKVGDIVKGKENSSSRYKVANEDMYKGKIVKVGDDYIDIEILEHKDKEFIGRKYIYLDPEYFKLVEYTYEDLKKSPIGTKIFFESGYILTKTKKDYYENEMFYRESGDLKGLKDNCGNRLLGKIIKIEEPEYTKVYEAKVEILDDVEKRYLRGVIRPYLDRIKSIEKYIFSTGKARIIITVKDGNDYWHINLPPFEKDTMYKNMKDDEQYTLEELGL